MRIIDEQPPRNSVSPFTRAVCPAAYECAAVSDARRGQPGSFLNLLRSVFLRIRIFQERRAAAERLAKMSDHELADIGLSRGELQSVFGAGFEPATSVRHRILHRPLE